MTIAIIIILLIALCAMYIICVKRDKGIASWALEGLKEDIKRLTEAREDLALRCTELSNKCNELDNECDRRKDAMADQLLQQALDVQSKSNQLHDEYLKTKHEMEKKIGIWEPMYQVLLAETDELRKNEDERRLRCLKLTEEDKEDINFLVKTVMPVVQNKEAIPKLIWSAYVQKPLSVLLDFVDAREDSGIYKITNIETKQSYIGQSTNVRRRLQDHFKAVCASQKTGDQVLHEMMWREGIDNFAIEILCYCPKDELDARESFFIKEFDSKLHGYNQNYGNGVDAL